MSSVCILQSEVIPQGLSFTDPDGRLFKRNGELLRGIPSERASFCQHLFNSGIMQELITKKLFVETEITPLKLKYYEIVLKHRAIPFISYPQEWCDMMLKDAALHHLDFCLELDRHDLRSADAHPLNILFDGCQPLFVDFGSIDPIPHDDVRWAWSRYEQFCRVFIHPLQLMAQGHARIAHWLLHDYELGILKSDLDALIHRPLPGLNLTRKLTERLASLAGLLMPEVIRTILNRVHTPRSRCVSAPSDLSQARRAFLKRVRREVESINLPLAQPITLDNTDISAWSPPLGNRDKNNRIVTNVLSVLRPSSVLNIGRGTPEVDISLLAAQCGRQVVVVNPDETHIRHIYVLAKSNGLPILPLQLDLFSPSCDLSNYWLDPASERLQCELVLALNLVDHLVKQSIRFDLIVKRLSSMAKRWLLVEFVPFESWEGCEIKTSQHSSYSLNSFMDELEKRFQSVKKILPQSDSRVLLLCEKSGNEG